MKFDKKIITIFIPQLSVMGIMAFLCITAWEIKREFAVKANTTIINLQNLERQNRVAARNITSYEESKRFYEKLNEKQRKPGGLRIDESEKFLENLYKKHHIIKPQTTISKPEITRNDKDLQILQSNLDLSLEAISDVNIFNFMDELMHNFPGFVRIMHLNMQKTRTINEQYIQNIEDGKISPAITAKISLKWQDVKGIK